MATGGGSIWLGVGDGRVVQVSPFSGHCRAYRIGRSLVALGLRALDLVGVLDPFARYTNRELVGQIARVQRQVDRKWQAFQKDPDWQSARAKSEEDGPLVARINNRLWKPTYYSPMK